MDPTPEWLAQQRLDAVSWSQDILSRRDWVIMDCESTGINDRAEIVELALLFPDGHLHVEQRIRPFKVMAEDNFAVTVHGITNDDLGTCPTWLDLHHTLRVLFYKRLILTYNARYDIRLIEQSARAWDVPSPVHFSDCVMLQYAKFVGEWWSSKRDFKWPKLPVLDGETAHGALSDCRSTLATIKRMAHGG